VSLSGHGNELSPAVNWGAILRAVGKDVVHALASPFQLGRDMNQLGIPNISASAITENPNF
jgi:hypothetical protein